MHIKTNLGQKECVVAEYGTATQYSNSHSNDRMWIPFLIIKLHQSFLKGPQSWCGVNSLTWNRRQILQTSQGLHHLPPLRPSDWKMGVSQCHLDHQHLLLDAISTSLWWTVFKQPSNLNLFSSMPVFWLQQLAPKHQYVLWAEKQLWKKHIN